MKITMLFLAGLIGFAQTISAQKPEVLTNKTITDLFKAGLDNSIIISKIESSPCKFDLSTAGLLALKKDNVPSDIIKEMMAKTQGKAEAAVPQPVEAKPTPTSTKIDLLNYVYASDAKPLEKALANRKTKNIVLGYGGVNTLFEIDGTASSVRIPAAQATGFLMKTGTDNAPDMMLYKLKTSKGKRAATFAKFGTGGSKGSQGGILINVSKNSNGTYQLNPAQSLERGEYFFISKAISNMGGMNAEVYAFGVD